MCGLWLFEVFLCVVFDCLKYLCRVFLCGRDKSSYVMWDYCV